jgi:hypothetical protein
MRPTLRSLLVSYLAVCPAVLAPRLSCQPCVASNVSAPADAVTDMDVPMEPAVDRSLALTPPQGTVIGSLDEELQWGSSQIGRVGRGSGERLIDRINDPTAWLMDIRFRQLWNWPVDASDPDTQTMEFRPNIPFSAWGQVNLLRVTVPYDLRGADGAGLGDIQILNLVVFEESWGRWGVGPSVEITANAGADGDTFRAGPAAGAVTKSKYWTVGILTQNFLSEGASESRIQPILAYKFDERWSVGIGESEFRYDWNDATWTQIPLGVQGDHIADVYGQKVQFFINPQYNFQRDSSNSGSTLFLGIVLLVPEA